jgi:hypothetical protein
LEGTSVIVDWRALLDLNGISVEKFEKCGFGRLLPFAPHYVVAQQNLGIKTSSGIFLV